MESTAGAAMDSQFWSAGMGICPFLRTGQSAIEITFMQRSTNAYNFTHPGAAMDSAAGTAMGVDAAAAMEITVDSISIEAIDAGVGAHLEHPGTPQTKSSSSRTVSYCAIHFLIQI